MKQDIKPYNDKGHAHGLWIGNKLNYKGYWINNKQYGYWYWINYSTNTYQITFFLR